MVSTLAKQSANKNMNLAELAVRSLEALVKSAPPFMMMEPQYEDVNLLLVATLCEVVEQK